MKIGNPEIFMGLDTSCYTTSLGIVNSDGVVINDLRRVLQVKSGDRGLRQSEALFQHLNNLPELVEEVMQSSGSGSILKAIGYSCRPRPVEGSYLPVFLAGTNFGRAMAMSARAVYYPFTHQEGHIRAAMEGTGLEKKGSVSKFLGFHLSGGTTEILIIKRTKGFRIDIETLGGTTDLHAGQMIDRLGVAMGLPFPAGPHLEELARARGNEKPSFFLPISVQGLSLSLSGPTSAAFRGIESGVPPSDLAWAVFDCLFRSISSLVENAVRKTGCTKVLFFGGVAANSFIRKELLDSLSQLGLYFARPRLSTDNAVGIALLAWEHWRIQNEEKDVDY